MKRLLKGARVVDPVNGIDGQHDVLIDGERIAQVGRDLPASLAAGGGADAAGRRRHLPRLHRHARPPPRARPGAQGDGRHRNPLRRHRRLTAVACMPNTRPVNDNAGVTALILQKAREANSPASIPSAPSRAASGARNWPTSPSCARPGASPSPTTGCRSRRRCWPAAPSSTRACSACRSSSTARTRRSRATASPTRARWRRRWGSRASPAPPRRLPPGATSCSPR